MCLISVNRVIESYLLILFTDNLSCVHFLVAEICKQGPDVGLCSDSVTQYYYDWSTGECKTFQYSGCRGNANRFPGLVECEAACTNIGRQPTRPTVEPGVSSHHFLQNTRTRQSLRKLLARKRLTQCFKWLCVTCLCGHQPLCIFLLNVLEIEHFIIWVSV